MQVVTIEIILQRPVTLGDVSRAAAALGGTLLDRVEGGIDMSTPAGMRDIRFPGVTCSVFSIYPEGIHDPFPPAITKENAEFVWANPSSATKKRHICETTKQTSKIAVKFTTRSETADCFTMTEIQRALDVIIREFGAYLKLGSPRQKGRLKTLLKRHDFDMSRKRKWEEASDVLWRNEPQYMLTYATSAEAQFNGIGLTPGISNKVDREVPIWVLEVVEFITEMDGENGWKALGGKYRHVGYMRAKFRTKKDACTYYDRHNPHMRSLNAHGTFESDWDPKTHRLYIVRKDYGCIDTVPPFAKDEEPTQSEDKFSSSSVYNYLK
jgi:hypothetical protein